LTRPRYHSFRLALGAPSDVSSPNSARGGRASGSDLQRDETEVRETHEEPRKGWRRWSAGGGARGEPGRPVELEAEKIEAHNRLVHALHRCSHRAADGEEVELPRLVPLVRLREREPSQRGSPGRDEVGEGRTISRRRTLRSSSLSIVSDSKASGSCATWAPAREGASA